MKLVMLLILLDQGVSHIILMKRLVISFMANIFNFEPKCNIIFVNLIPKNDKKAMYLGEPLNRIENLKLSREKKSGMHVNLTVAHYFVVVFFVSLKFISFKLIVLINSLNSCTKAMMMRALPFSRRQIKRVGLHSTVCLICSSSTSKDLGRLRYQPHIVTL